MLDLTKYNLEDDDILFLREIEDACINGQNEIILEYKGKSFVLEPLGKAVQVVEVADKIAGRYESFDDLLLNYKVEGKTLIEIVKELEFGE
ncbi:MAG: hypothetical protein IJ515_06325 [Clostridia bacterium]|nr:hypothetical protein [Clostridia bacterium]